MGTVLSLGLGSTRALASTPVAPFSPIVDLNSGGHSCLDVANLSTANGANVHQWQCTGNANQQWTLVTSQVPGYYTVRNENSGACLDVARGSIANGANVQQWGCWDGPQQLWTPIPSYAPGYFSLKNYKSGRCLDVAGSSTANGTNVQQWGCWNTPGQQWAGNSLAAAYRLNTPPPPPAPPPPPPPPAPPPPPPPPAPPPAAPPPVPVSTAPPPPPAPPGRVHARVQLNVILRGGLADLLSARILLLPPHGEVIVRCRGRGCRRGWVVIHPRRARRSVLERNARRHARRITDRLLHGGALHLGDRLVFTLTAPGLTPERLEFVIHRNRIAWHYL